MKLLPAIVVLALAFNFCGNKKPSARIPEYSRGISAAPNYSVVFPDKQINRIDISIDPEKRNELQADLMTYAFQKALGDYLDKKYN